MFHGGHRIFLTSTVEFHVCMELETRVIDVRYEVETGQVFAEVRLPLGLDAKINSIRAFMSENHVDISPTLQVCKPSTKRSSERIEDITKSLSNIMELNTFFSPTELTFENSPKNDMGKLDHLMCKIEAIVANITQLETKIRA